MKNLILVWSLKTVELEKNQILNFKLFLKPISGRVDKASATEAINVGSIPGWVKPKTIEIAIRSFPAWHSALKGTMWSLHRE